MCTLLRLAFAFVPVASTLPGKIDDPSRSDMDEPRISSSFGSSLAILPAQSPDKSPRIVVANERCPLDVVNASGRAYVFSDGWGTRTQVLSGTVAGTEFGTCLAANGSWLVVGVSTTYDSEATAALEVYRASDLEHVRRIKIAAGKRVGSIGFVPDADADGLADLLVEASRWKPSTSEFDVHLVLVSTATGALIREFAASGERKFQTGLFFVRDANSVSPWIAGTTWCVRTGPQPRWGAVLLSLQGEAQYVPFDASNVGSWAQSLDLRRFTASDPTPVALVTVDRSTESLHVRWLEPKAVEKNSGLVLQEVNVPVLVPELWVHHASTDLDRDGVADFVATGRIDRADFDVLTLAAFDGMTGRPLWQWTNDLIEASPGPIVPAWDVDGDGVTDLLVGVTPCEGRGTSTAVLVSGSTGRILASFHEP